MRVKYKIRQYFIGNQLSLILLATIILGCTNQQSSKLATKLTSTSTKNTIFAESSSEEKPQSKNTETKSISSFSKMTSNSQQISVSQQNKSISNSKLKPGWNKDLNVDNVAYDLYIPNSYNQKKPIRSLLVLPGWNYSRASWIENTNLKKYSDRYGYILILPEMGKTLYASTYYPETSMKWNSISGGKFIKENFIPAIQQEYGLLQPDQYNTLLGLSTGGRGVALIALENPGLFAAGASLSGDFSQENTPSDRLMTSVYGSFWEFKDRWLGRDNPQSRVVEWKMPLYLAHGIQDNIVPESQSRLFHDALIKQHGDQVIVQYNPVQNAQHDYKFWGEQLPYVFQFFLNND